MTEADHNTDADASARPVVRLRPKRGGRFKQGAPWVYGDELVLDRRTKALAPGTLAELQDAERRPLGLVAVNSGATLAARLIDPNPAAVIDVDWFSGKLRRAMALRTPFFDTSFYRLVHAEADGLPGVVIDRFGDAAVIQPNAAWADARLDALIDALTSVAGVSNIVVNAGSRTRALEGLDDVTRVASGIAGGADPRADEWRDLYGGSAGRSEDRAVLRSTPQSCSCGAAIRIRREGRGGVGRILPCRRVRPRGAGGGREISAGCGWAPPPRWNWRRRARGDPASLTVSRRSAATRSTPCACWRRTGGASTS